MSYDQKPARIKLVANSGAVGAPGAEAQPASAVEQAGEGVQAVAEETAGRGLSLFSVILFMVGCAIGGAALAAFPHFAS
tara:strand:- start:1383 stop:1619 length:237 start_codon:yes stop_codon:yes gene_type:complete